ncbi:MAG: transposase [bacterium]|nr:transposase [bacterium]
MRCHSFHGREYRIGVRGRPKDAEKQILKWLDWAARSRLKPFVRLGMTVRKHLKGILAAIESKLTNARLDGTNSKIRLINHRAYGFQSAEALIGMVYLCCTKITLPDPHIL